MVGEGGGAARGFDVTPLLRSCSSYMVKKSTGAPRDLKTLSLGCGRVLCYVRTAVFRLL